MIIVKQVVYGDVTEITDMGHGKVVRLPCRTAKRLIDKFRTIEAAIGIEVKFHIKRQPQLVILVDHAIQPHNLLWGQPVTENAETQVVRRTAKIKKWVPA